MTTSMYHKLCLQYRAVERVAYPRIHRRSPTCTSVSGRVKTKLLSAVLPRFPSTAHPCDLRPPLLLQLLLLSTLSGDPHACLDECASHEAVP